MIQAEEAIRAARNLIGTSYETLDCINLIKKVIRTAPGGDKRYTTAGTNELWNSFDSVPKYRHLTWRQTGISGAKPGMLAFMGVGTGDVNHTGLVTERGTVIHSSKSRGCVVETELTEKRGWNGLGKHRMIAVCDNNAEGDEIMFGNATVKTQTVGSYVNLRGADSTKSKVIGKVHDGERVDVVCHFETGWYLVKTQTGADGCVSANYVVKDAPGTDAAEDDGEAPNTTTLRRSDGVYITLAGKWEIAED